MWLSSFRGTIWLTLCLAGLPTFAEEAIRIDQIRSDTEKDIAEAPFQLGTIYFTGERIERDYEEAARWFRLAATQGNSDVQVNLGFLYAGGSGVPKNERATTRLHLLAAGQGNGDAQFFLAESHFYGRGVARDDEKALRWFRTAADNGDVDARYYLAEMYFNGEWPTTTTPRKRVRIFTRELGVF